MKTLWLTYAWKDNEDDDVDFIAAKLKDQGIEVRVDRTRLLSGSRLWDQIGAEISKPDVDGWAIYATENSLASEPCQEELAYALDRALRSKGAAFPLIGIFPSPLDRAIIPSSIAVRLWVHLKDNEWSAKVSDGLNGQNTAGLKEVDPIDFKVHRSHGRVVCEIRPRDGNWYPAIVGVPDNDAASIKQVWKGPKGMPFPNTFNIRNVSLFTMKSNDEILWRFCQIGEQVDSTCALYAEFSRLPEVVAFGSPGNLSTRGLQ